MIHLGRHIRWWASVFALLFFFSVSGFTAIVRVCTMKPMACCMGPGQMSNRTCDNGSPSVPGKAVFSNSVCHVDLVAGGLNSVQGLVEKDAHSPVKTVAAAFLAPYAQDVAFNRSDDVSFALINQISPPPAVEKYILTASFLI